MPEQFAAAETVTRLPFLPEADTALQVGGLAAGRHLQLVTPEAGPSLLSPLQSDVISLVSQGNTYTHVARQLDIPVDNVKEVTKDIRAAFGKKHNLSSAVDHLIKEGAIEIEVRPDDAIKDQLSNMDRTMLGAYAKGTTNELIARQLGRHVKVIEDYHDRLLKKVGAWSRPHAIRRAYELGVLKLPAA